MKNLPLELKQEIVLYLGLIKTVSLFPKIAHYVYDHKKYTLDWYARHGYLEIVKWLHLNRTEGCTKAAMDWAEKKGHTEIVEWLHQNSTYQSIGVDYYINYNKLLYET